MNRIVGFVRKTQSPHPCLQSLPECCPSRVARLTFGTVLAASSRIGETVRELAATAPSLLGGLSVPSVHLAANLPTTTSRSWRLFVTGKETSLLIPKDKKAVSVRHLAPFCCGGVSNPASADSRDRNDLESPPTASAAASPYPATIAGFHYRAHRKRAAPFCLSSP